MLGPKLWRGRLAQPKILWSKLREDRRGVIALFFAMALIPLILVVSIAIDYSFAIQARAQLNLAADAAAMQAVRVASQSLTGGATVAQSTAAGITAGQQWWAAQLGTITTATVGNNGVNVSLTYNPTPGAFTATVTYTGAISTRLGLSAITASTWTINGSASALVTNSYLEVLMMLDNSSSMQIGATYSDINNMMQATPCSSMGEWPQALANAYVQSQGATPGSPGGTYDGYDCGYNGATYPPEAQAQLECPLIVYPPFAISPLPTYAFSGNPTNAPLCTQSAKINGQYPYMATPCAFACHWDNSKPAGTGSDYYALARSTIGTAKPVTLRFDNLKYATNTLLTTMQTSTQVGANLSVGIYAFNSTLSQVYPTTGEAGTDFTAAINAVGLPPTASNQPDTGIQPDVLVGSALHADTYLNASMTQLAGQVTASGDGTSAASPRKVLFLITDGVDDSDPGNTVPALINSSACQGFKDLGYTVYVIYTKYYALMHLSYFATGMVPLTEGTGPGSIVYALQQCATNSNDYIEATQLSEITAALELFLDAALNGPGRITN